LPSEKFATNTPDGVAATPRAVLPTGTVAAMYAGTS